MEKRTAPQGADFGSLTGRREYIIIYWMYKLVVTEEFDNWIARVKDRRAVAVVRNHLDRMAAGNLGVTRQVGGDVYEKKINYAGGYRLYYFLAIGHLIVLLCGGTKRTQERDIKMALKLRKEIYDSKAD